MVPFQFTFQTLQFLVGSCRFAKPCGLSAAGPDLSPAVTLIKRGLVCTLCWSGADARRLDGANMLPCEQVNEMITSQSRHGISC